MQERKQEYMRANIFGLKSNIFSFELKSGFPLSGMKESFKNICVNERKWLSTSQKIISHSQE